MSGKTNRTKGHNFERDVVKKFKEIGMECSTSRYSNRELDDAKVDIDFKGKYPLSIQCKCHNIFKSPVNVITEMPQDSNYNIVLQKVKNKGVYAILTADDFYEIMDMLTTNNIL